MPEFSISDVDKALLSASNIDAELTARLVHTFGAQQAAHTAAERKKGVRVRALKIPEIDNRRIIDARAEIPLNISERRAAAQLAKYIPYSRMREYIMPMLRRAATADGAINWSNELLAHLGRELYPVSAYGLFNGGSATSYLDPIHNRKLGDELFQQWQPYLQQAAERYSNSPKALCPALYHADGSGAESFMELHIRHLLAAARVIDDAPPSQKQEDANATANIDAINEQRAAIRLFQMTSQSNNDTINAYTEELYERYLDHERARACYTSGGAPLSAPQPLIATFCSSGEGRLDYKNMPSFFRDGRAEGAERIYGLPGGHGQCFYVLREILMRLFDDGVRFISLGNIDNLGYTLHPAALAYLVLREGEALFEYVPRSPVDIKGGVLAQDEGGSLLCAELGAGLTLDDVLKSEAEGLTVFFNCAIGLFDLEALLLKLDHYLEELLVHALHKKTARGEYWQLEQITWDIMALIEDPYIFAGHKRERFLAAKVVSESFILSGLPIKGRPPITETAHALFEAMKQKAAREYALEYGDGRWHKKNI